MSGKTTAELISELKQVAYPSLFLRENEDDMILATLANHLTALLLSRDLKKADVIRRSGLHEIYAYQIFDGRKTPARDKIIALCFGFPLDLDDTQTLLKHAGLAPLYPRDKRDAVIIFALNRHLTIMTCNDLLFEMTEYILE